jgi:hypothetical protein
MQCLQEMPFEKDRAVSFVSELRKYIQYQSTIEILEKPPANYPMPPTDLLGGLDDIQKKAASEFYTNQYDFDAAIRELVNSAYDGHLYVDLCTQQAFLWESNTPLVSISSNGTALPKVYAYSMSSSFTAEQDQNINLYDRGCFGIAVQRYTGFSRSFRQWG